MLKKTTPAIERSESHRYMSKAWRAEYGATLTVDEVRLLQGFRGLDRDTQALVAAVMPELMLPATQRSLIVALRRALRTLGKDNLTHDAENLKAWAREADRAARGGLPVQIPSGVRSTSPSITLRTTWRPRQTSSASSPRSKPYRRSRAERRRDGEAAAACIHHNTSALV